MQHGQGAWALGWDCSQFNGVVDWNLAGGRLAQFAIIRATDGLTIRDTLCAQNAQQARMRRVPHGFYLVADPTGIDPADGPALVANGNGHAAAFLRLMASLGGYQGWMLRPYIDSEGIPNGWTPEQTVTWLAQIAGSVDAAIRDPNQIAGLYANTATLRALSTAANVADIAHRPLWVAWWDLSQPPPSVGPWAAWEIWQLTDHKSLPVDASPVDWDEWAAPVTDLPVPPPVITPGVTTVTVEALQNQLTTQAQALTAQGARLSALETQTQTVSQQVAAQAAKLTQAAHVLGA